MARKREFPVGSVCKPCWELKYCPYGPLVEFFPLLGGPVDLDTIRARYREIVEELKGPLPDEKAVWDLVEQLMYHHPDNWEMIEPYDPVVVGCNVWGHVCPVFFTQSGATETRESRREGRYIPRDVLIKVARRDNYHCQACGKHLKDNELEFDHIIPVSRGGPVSVENIRILCSPCNKKKGDSLGEIL